MVRWVVGGWLIAGSALLGGGAAWAAGSSTGETGDTGGTGGTGTSTTYGTDYGTTTCDDCVSLSESIGEPGGSPCDSGCATSGPMGGLSSVGAIAVLAAAVGVRRRARG